MSSLPLRILTAATTLALCISCNEKSSELSPEQQAARDAANLRIGHVMVEVGHRMETAGRASIATQWDLAGYEVHEIIEVFDDDMSRALLPGVCNDDIADQMYFLLKDEQLPALRQAAEDEDAGAFRAGFATAAASCNGCHASCEVAFIEVPTETGVGVPRIALPSNTAGTQAATEAPVDDDDAPAAGAPSSPGREVLDPWGRE